MRNKEQMNHTVSDMIPWDTLSWWLVLTTAVIAIPSLGFIMVTVAGIEGLMGLAVFITTCWSCTYLGMFLVAHSSMKEKRDFTKTFGRRFEDGPQIHSARLTGIYQYDQGGRFVRSEVEKQTQ